MLDKHSDSQKSTTESHGVERRIDINQQELRDTIAERVDVESEVSLAVVVTDVAREHDIPESTVKHEIDRLEANGFVYLVGDGSSAEVRLP
jgi:DNA-binding MarR family transcriptional regulator